MLQKIIQKSHVTQLTKNKEYNYPNHSSKIGEIEFTHNFNPGYFNAPTFKKINDGGCEFGGNYLYTEQNDEYRISKY
ncbi:hypothetical protein [Flagellimonas sp.]|jgi:hypothetical protein|uniref:hypothetical protein n=1 Tax=Flagellimonas sp. TaxID=2058762 RepID=UPI000B760987|nr:MAG: hypothetical protein CBB72_015500 [Muricauda sp. TMED12]|tara:strand:+ start:18648 stop:18878 length:231 start_codon:yes stop_codon:yes gene_type:complete